MKKITISLFMAIATLSFGQKKEVSAAFKAIENNDMATASAQLSAADSVLNGNIHFLTPELQEQYYYAKGIVAFKQGKNTEGASYLAKINDLGKATIYTGKDSNKNRVYFVGKTAADASGVSGLKQENYAPKHLNSLINFVNPLINSANNAGIEAYNAKKFGEAGKKFEEAYYLLAAVGQNNGQLLYNAALCYVNAKENDRAISAFKRLIETNYNGVETTYTAKNKKTGQIETMDKTSWDLMKKTQDYTDFKTETSKNIEQDLYDAYGTILVDNDKNDEAIDFLSKAIAKYPKNARFGTLQGLAYYKAGRTDEFTQSLRSTLEKNPNDAMNWYNLGVILSNDEAQKNEAKQAFEKAIALDPKMESAYQNLGNLIIGNDAKVIEEYNALRKAGKSADAVKLMDARRERFAKAIPVFEKWYSIAPNNLDVVTMLKGLYQSTRNEAKYNEFKAKEAALKK